MTARETGRFLHALIILINLCTECIIEQKTQLLIGKVHSMKNIFEEEFDWILDEPKWKTKPRRDEESYCFNREFVKAFGLKSDCVGWCTLKGKNLNRELLEAIRQKDDDEKMHIRG